MSKNVSVKMTNSAKRKLDKDLKNFSKAFGYTSDQALDATALYIRNDAMKILGTNKTNNTGQLQGSIAIEKPMKNARTVGTTTGYGLYVEFGRGAGKMPPLETLIDWVRLKLKIDAKKAKGVAFMIGRKIARAGTKGQPFLRPAYDRGIKRMVINYRKQFAKQK